MDELITKRDAIGAVNDVLAEYIPTFKQWQEGIPLKCALKIKALPAVGPKHGKWIERGTWSEGEGMGETYGKYWACNQCGRKVKGFWDECGKNFCDNCGADMRGSKDGTD